MGKSILKPMSGNKVAPILDETSILKDSSLVSFFGFSFLQLIDIDLKIMEILSLFDLKEKSVHFYQLGLGGLWSFYK